MVLVAPGVVGGVPATMTTRSSRLADAALSSAESTWRTISSVCWTVQVRSASAPHESQLALHLLVGREGEETLARSAVGTVSGRCHRSG